MDLPQHGPPDRPGSRSPNVLLQRTENVCQRVSQGDDIGAQGRQRELLFPIIDLDLLLQSHPRDLDIGDVFSRIFPSNFLGQRAHHAGYVLLKGDMCLYEDSRKLVDQLLGADIGVT